MKKLIISILFFFFCNFSNAQNEFEIFTIDTSENIVNTIDLKGQTKIIKDLKSYYTPTKTKIKLADSILLNHLEFYPPAILAASRVMYIDAKRPFDAVFLFYLGQARSKLDANLCVDTGIVRIYQNLTMVYGVSINNFTKSNVDTVHKILQKVLDIIDTNNGNYDHRWIALHSKTIFKKDKSSLEDSDLIKPNKDWKSIRIKTLNEYYQKFVSTFYEE